MKFALNADRVRTQWPPRGGWKYVELATGWQAPNPMEDSFDETLKRIQLHRQANPGYELPTDLSTIAEDLMDQTANRIIRDSPDQVDNWVVPVDEEAKKKSPTGSLSLQQPLGGAAKRGVVERLLSRVRGLANGVATLAEWIGEGAVPVPQSVAERRARTCLSCTLNKPGSAVTDAVADAVRGQVIVKNALSLSTSFEDKLETCEACGCNLRLKVWVPLPTIKKHMSQETEARLDSMCWITHESAAVNLAVGSGPVLKRTITMRRKAAFGDVILSTIVAEKLNEIGIGVRLATEPIIAKALVGHRFISELVPLEEKADLVLDGTYEQNLERTKKDIALLMLEAAQADLKPHGIELKDLANRVPVLDITDAERWRTVEELQRFAKPWIVVVDGSGSWPNRQWDSGEIKKLPGLLEGSLIWSKPWSWKAKPTGYANYEVKDFRHLMCVVACCDLVITPDTGPIHLAAAFNKPVVVFEQCNDTHLRLTNLTDWVAVPAKLDCVRCGEFKCPIDKDTPPCQKIEAERVADAARTKLDSCSNGKVSAIIPVLNWRQESRVAVDRVVGQVDDVVVVMDGTSPPPSPTYKKLRVMESTGKRIGYGKTNMRAIRETTSEFLLLLNDDCHLEPDAVAKMREAMTDGVAVVGALLFYKDGRIQHGGCFRPKDAVGFGHLDWGKKESRFTKPTEMEAVTFACALVRREAFYEVRGFDERYDCYWEDADCCMKLREAGWRIMFQPLARGIHDESKSAGPLKNRMIEDGAVTFFAKWKRKMQVTKSIF